MKTTIYTCTFPDYDQLFPPVRRTPGAEYVLFSDRKPPLLPVWSWRPIPEAVAGRSQTEMNRYCKFFPHKVLPDQDLTIYVDGSILILGDLTPLIDDFLASGAPIGLFPQLRNRSFRDEANAALKVGKIPARDVDLLNRQLQRYEDEGFSADHPLTANYIIFRNHRVSRMEQEMEMVWSELMNFTKRDQVSFPYVLYKCRTKVHSWDWNPTFFRNPFFRVIGHRRKWYHKLTAPFHFLKYYFAPPRTVTRVSHPGPGA